MANELGRVEVVLSGFTGAPGFMHFHFQGSTPGLFSTADATAAVAAVRAWLLTSASAFSNAVQAQVTSAVEVVDWVSGALIAVRAATGVLAVAGTATTPVLVAEGPLASLYTTTVINRRLLRGRLFLTPSGNNAVDGAGKVTAAVQAAVQGASSTLISVLTVTWSVWHRPSPFSTGNNGTVGAVVNVVVPSRVAVLRSRRD